VKSLVLALALLWAAPVPQKDTAQQKGPAQQKGTEQKHAPERKALERVVVVGASLSAGFGADRRFVDVIDASLRVPHQPPLGLGEELFFTDPLHFGARQASAALDAEPTLLVALDFLFWFGYGDKDANGGPIEMESERLELLEHGLKMLDEVECPLFVGDFPDMSASVGKMLSPAQMPSKTTLPLLSKRVREWAAARKQTFVVPLSEIVTQLHSTHAVQIGRHTFPEPARLLQEDQLHPTVDGLVAVAQLICDQLVTAKLARPEELELDLDAVMDKLHGRRIALPASTGPR